MREIPILRAAPLLHQKQGDDSVSKISQRRRLELKSASDFTLLTAHFLSSLPDCTHLHNIYIYPQLKIVFKVMAWAILGSQFSRVSPMYTEDTCTCSQTFVCFSLVNLSYINSIIRVFLGGQSQNVKGRKGSFSTSRTFCSQSTLPSDLETSFYTCSCSVSVSLREHPGVDICKAPIGHTTHLQSWHTLPQAMEVSVKKETLDSKWSHLC